MIITLEAPENQYYTQVEDVEIQFRVLAKKIFLAVNDSEDNWKLITTEEYSEFKTEKEKWFEQKKAESDKILEDALNNVAEVSETEEA
jgi:hypothetical protein